MRKNGQKKSKPRTLQIAQKRLGTTDVFDHCAEAIPVVAEPLPASLASVPPSYLVLCRPIAITSNQRLNQAFLAGRIVNSSHYHPHSNDYLSGKLVFDDTRISHLALQTLLLLNLSRLAIALHYRFGSISLSL